MQVQSPTLEQREEGGVPETPGDGGVPETLGDGGVPETGAGNNRSREQLEQLEPGSVQQREDTGLTRGAVDQSEQTNILEQRADVEQADVEYADVLAELQPDAQQHQTGVFLSQRSLEEIPSIMDWEEVSSEASDAINNVVDNIVDRMRVERMFELRRIQYGDRAVSSGERAQQLEGLFNQEPEEIARRAPGSESVRNELEELARTRSVGNLLNARFRTLLENSLSAPPQPLHERLTARRAMPAAPSAAPSAALSAARSAAPPPAPPAPPIGGRRARVDTEYSRAPLREEVVYTPPDFADRQFDYAITDVEELFQRRLVSDVLHSAFRNVLELHIERRLVRAGVAQRHRDTTLQRQRDTALQRHVQQHRAPHSLHQQNFQEQQRVAQLGLTPIAPGPSAASSASMSRRLPEIERQIHAMSIEMKEMKGMLKLLVDTQLDIQRSIRQEVNAMMSSSTVTPTKPTKQFKEGQCVVCLELACDTVLYRCGHLCCCFNCARLLRVEGHHCPVCRAQVTDIMRIYRSTNND